MSGQLFCFPIRTIDCSPEQTTHLSNHSLFYQDSLKDPVLLSPPTLNCYVTNVAHVQLVPHLEPPTLRPT